MLQIFEILTQVAGMIIGVVTFLFQLETELLFGLGSGVTIAVILVASGPITEILLAYTRRWHGSIDEQFANIDNLVNLIVANQPTWVIPADLLAEIKAFRDELRTLIVFCRTPAASPLDRSHRNVALKQAVGLCLTQIKLWAYGQYAAGVLTEENIHALGFLLPGENGGNHERVEATNVKAEVKVTVLNEDAIRVVIDQSAGENAALVQHGWPHGVKNAIIVIYASDGTTEVVRQLTTRLHTDIYMPRESRGKQFAIKAAFLRHVNDTPLFGSQPTFSMPLNTVDLLAILDRQHHEEFEERVRAVEQHRQEVEQLKANV
ncbi:MAG: hypothetical protein LBS12_05700 [Prevotellaceae bacterium]|jgi:hypothetical protein|nr:hypothetical protein [Prevotellaceae bacterium]